MRGAIVRKMGGRYHLPMVILVGAKARLCLLDDTSAFRPYIYLIAHTRFVAVAVVAA